MIKANCEDCTLSVSGQCEQCQIQELYVHKQREIKESQIIPEPEPDYWEKLRHQFAGQAIEGLLSNPDITTLTFAEMASDAKGYADALIAELKVVK